MSAIAVAGVLLAAAVGCAPVPKLTTTLDLALSNAQATGRHMDDMSFAIPPQNLMRCTRNFTRLHGDSDPSPDLDAPIDPNVFGEGCVATRKDDDEQRRVLDVVGIHVDVSAEGRPSKVRILDRVGDPDPSLDFCLLSNAKRFAWPANRHGRPYEKHIFNVFALNALGETNWRMMDTVRRLSMPRRAVCQCLRDSAPDLAVEMSVTFRLPASRYADVAAQNLLIRSRDPIGICLESAIRAEHFTSSGLAVDVDYIYHFDPSDVAVEQAIADGSATMPTDADDPIIAIRLGRSGHAPAPPNP
jgi:hypothetical protein